MIRVAYLLLVLEGIFGGGGRLLEIGPITVRMVLFALALILTLMTIAARGKLPEAQLTVMLLVSFLIVQGAGLVIGLSRGNPFDAVWTDLQPLLFWLVAPFVAIAAEDRRNVYATRGMIIAAGIVMSLGYLLVLVALVLGRIDFAWFYQALNATGEFMFRGESFFFYKGFVYLGVCIVFLIAMPGRYSKLLLALTTVALILTLTRGFLISTAIAVLLLLYALRMRVAAALGTLAAAVVSVVLFATLFSGTEGFGADRSDSNAIRLEDIAFVLANVNPVTLLFGNGFGTPVAERLNVENTYLWIVWKSGLVGLVFWLAPLVICVVAFSRISRQDPNFRLGCALLFSTVLIYVQSAMNPYLNNPIGLLVVLIAVYGLRSLSRREVALAVSGREVRLNQDAGSVA